MATATIETYVEQVEDGKIYKGYIEFANKKRFNYEVTFKISLNQLQEEDIDDVNVNDLIQITVKNNGEIIKFEQNEEDIFLFLAIDSILDALLTTRINCNELAKTLSCEPSSASSYSMNMESSKTFELSPEVCAMLNDPKFDCQIPTD